jgi:hypothetical protein
MANAEKERIRRIEDLVRRMELIPDPESRQTAHSLMEGILALHGAGLERIMEIVFDAGESGKATIRRLAADDLVASILMLHGLHPDELETRVHRALAKANGKAELVGVFEGVVRVRLTAGGCGLKESVEAAILEAAPDAAEIVIEESPAFNNFVPLMSVGKAVQIA